MNLLKSRLRDFMLSGIYNSVEERIAYANDKGISYTEFLELLLEDEVNNRRANGYKKRYAKAKFPYYKTLEDFDYGFQPSIDKRVISDCATCQFIADKKNIVFIGNPGTDKTHSGITVKDGLDLFSQTTTRIRPKLKYAGHVEYRSSLKVYLTLTLQ